MATRLTKATASPGNMVQMVAIFSEKAAPESRHTLNATCLVSLDGWMGVWDMRIAV